MPRANLHFDAIGAPWSIETDDPLVGHVVSAIAERVESYDRSYSRFRADSLVSEMAKRPGVWELPPDADNLLALYRVLYDATDGAVTPLVGGRLENLGYDREYSLRPTGDRASVPSWDDVMSWDGERLTTTEPVVLDLGAAGKGYLADLVSGVLYDAGIDDFVVDASGDIVHAGSEPTRIALEHPIDPSKAIGIYELSNGALCASAPGRRSWGTGLHHILDGRSGDPTTEVAATWAMASNGLTADGLATALFFASGAALTRSLGDAARFDYVRMFPDSRVEVSTGFTGELFTGE